MNPETGSRPTSPDLDLLVSRVRQRPLRALTFSAGVGFVVGGGLRSRLGLALGISIGRMFAGTALINTIEAFSEHNGRQHRPNQR